MSGLPRRARRYSDAISRTIELLARKTPVLRSLLVDHGFRGPQSSCKWVYDEGVECKERYQLLCEYERAVLLGSLARTALMKVAKEPTSGDYQELLDLQQKSNVEIRKACSACEQHISEHGCT